MRKYMLAIFFLLILIGCNSNQESINQEDIGVRMPEENEVKYTIGNPTAEDVLRMNPNANILMFKDTIYNAGVDWVNELRLTKDKVITEIIAQTVSGKEFMDGTANKLKIGTKIFSVKERNDILIAETNNGDIRFYMLVEG